MSIDESNLIIDVTQRQCVENFGNVDNHSKQFTKILLGVSNNHIISSSNDIRNIRSLQILWMFFVSCERNFFAKAWKCFRYFDYLHNISSSLSCVWMELNIVVYPWWCTVAASLFPFWLWIQSKRKRKLKSSRTDTCTCKCQKGFVRIVRPAGPVPKYQFRNPQHGVTPHLTPTLVAISLHRTQRHLHHLIHRRDPNRLCNFNIVLLRSGPQGRSIREYKTKSGPIQHHGNLPLRCFIQPGIMPRRGFMRQSSAGWVNTGIFLDKLIGRSGWMINCPNVVYKWIRCDQLSGCFKTVGGLGDLSVVWSRSIESEEISRSGSLQSAFDTYIGWTTIHFWF